MRTQHIVKRLFGSHAAAPPKGRIMADSKLIWVNVICQDGIPRRVAGKEGQSLAEVLRDFLVPDFDPGCLGTDPELPPHQLPYDYYTDDLVCGTCEVIV